MLKGRFLASESFVVAALYSFFMTSGAIAKSGGTYAPGKDFAGTAALPGEIETFAGGYVGDGGLAAVAGLNFPKGIAVDSAGNIYIADTSNNRIRKVAGA